MIWESSLLMEQLIVHGRHSLMITVYLKCLRDEHAFIIHSLAEEDNCEN